MKTKTKATLVILGIFAVVCCGGPLVLWMVYASGSSGLSAGVRAYRDAGLPWTAAELEPPVPLDQDGGPQLIKVFQRLELLRASTTESEVFQSIDKGDFAEATRDLAPFQGPLDLVVEAVRRPKASFHKDWDEGPMVLFPEMATSKASVKLLCDRAAVRAKSKEIVGSNNDLAAAWMLSERMGDEPILIGFLVQAAERLIVMKAVERCAAIEADDLSAITSLHATVAKMDQPLDFRRPIRGEAYMHLNIVRNLSFYGPRLRAIMDGTGPSQPINPKDVRRDGNPGGFYASVLGGPVLSNIAKIAKLAEADKASPHKLEVDLGEFDKKAESQGTLSELLSQVLDPSYDGAGKAFVRNVAATRTTQALVEALVIRAQTGHFPKSISDLPTRWLDPTDGMPIRMRATAKSIRFWAAGDDGKDHGGVNATESKVSNEYDVVAGYPPPPHSPLTTSKKPR